MPRTRPPIPAQKNPGLRPSWDTMYMSMCYLMAYRSPDESTKVGAVITTDDHVHVCSGYNGLPRGMENLPEYQVRPEKYFYFEHAERNAIYNGARVGIRMDLAHTLYITWIPCADCARAIVQTGVERVIYHSQGQRAFNHAKSVSDWGVSQAAAMHVFGTKVEVVRYDGPIMGNLRGYFAGQVYSFHDANFYHEAGENYYG